MCLETKSFVIPQIHLKFEFSGHCKIFEKIWGRGGVVDGPSEATRFWRRFEGGRGGQQLSLVKAQVFGEDSWEERGGQQLSLVKPQVFGEDSWEERGGAAAVSSEATEVQFGRQTFVFPKGLFNRRS